MKKDYYSNSKDYINRWVVSYADFVTMLLALFMVLFAVSRIDNNKMSDVQDEMRNTFKVQAQELKKAKQEIITKDEELTQVMAEAQKIKDEQEKQRYSIEKDVAELENLFKDSVGNNSSITLMTEQRGLVIRMNNALLFDNGSAKIKKNAEKSLSTIVKTLTKIDNPVIIEGHTDSTPIQTDKYPSNWELSTARATNIIKYMVKIGSINPKRLCAVGYGEYMPVDDNTTNSGRMLNRRVDIIVLANNKEIGE